MTSGELQRGGQSAGFARLLAVFLASALALVGFGAAAPPAVAQTPGITTTVLHNGTQLNEDAVVRPGDTLTINTRYTNEVEDGAEVLIGIPEGVTLDESSLEMPGGNTAIESITEVDYGIQFTFTDPFPNIHEGVHALQFTFDEVEHTGSQTITWTVDGAQYQRQIIVVESGDQQENVSNWVNKTSSGNIYNPYVSIDEDGQVQFSDNITDYQFDYTLTVNTAGGTDRSNFIIADEISEFLTYNNDFSAEITTWDEIGWNQETNDFDFSPTVDGSSFSATVDIPRPSELTITYSASLNPAEVDDLRGLLQTQYEALEGGYGGIGEDLENIAMFGGSETSGASVEVGLLIQEPAPAPGPEPGQAFNKSADWSSQNVEPAEDGTLEPPVDITYTFTADLSQWDGEAAEGYGNEEDFNLDRNVIITDTLPEQAEWNTSVDDFIVADGMDLTLAEDFDGGAAEFAADGYVGQYFVDGRELFINIGQSHETQVSISAKALITTVDGIWPWEQPGTGFEIYNLVNNGEFYYSDGDPYASNESVELIDRGDTSDGAHVPDRFSKNADGDDEPIYVAPGESVTLDYTFVVNDGWHQDDAVDVTTSYIVDHRDPNVFDLSNLDEIQSGISGEYAWRDLTSEHFDVSVNDDNDLVIQLSEAGITQINDWDNDWDHGTDARLMVNIPLTTVPLDGRQTIEVENSATLYGEDEEALYWSETTSQASSYGNEAELRKTIRDTPNGEWTQNLRLEIGEDGDLVQDELVYNLAYIPHGNFAGLEITEAVDELPDEVEFLGFVTHDNVDSGDNPVPGPFDIGGNLEAVYDEDNHTVTLRSQEDQLLVQEPNISANVLVRVTEDFEVDAPVTNVLGHSTTTFTPSDGYPLSINKVDSTDDEVVINDPDSRFRVLDADDNVLVEDAFVEDGQLRVLDDEGEVSGLVVSEPGTYYVEETVAPRGYELSTDTIEVVVDEDGTSDPVTFTNIPLDEPEVPSFAIGDFVWIDANDNGVQDDGEEPLEDVTVVLFDGDGVELDRTTTDDEGRYLFDELEAGEYQVQFILTEDQAELYEFTSYTSGDDSEVDSDAGQDGFSGTIVLNDDNEFLTADEDYEYDTVLASQGIDPTWDAGVVLIPEPEVPAVGIIKGDGDAAEGTIDNDANTEEDAVAYEDGETRDIVILVENTGSEDLVDVVLTDETLSGADIEELVWTLPDGETTIEAEEAVNGVLTATWDGPWAPGEVITGVATLTLAEGEDLHTNEATVTAEGAASGETVGDDDPYNGTPPTSEPEDPTDPSEPDEPTEPADPTDPSDPAAPADPEDPQDDERDPLASTGATVAALALIAALLVGIGVFLSQRASRQNG